MTYQVIIPVLVAFAITAVLGPIMIPFLRKLKIGNTEREELQSHQKKNGTPTMGGIMILIAVLCKRISEGHSDPVCNRGIWNHWFSG